jgi:hypothetical protein
VVQFCFDLLLYGLTRFYSAHETQGTSLRSVQSQLARCRQTHHFNVPRMPQKQLTPANTLVLVLNRFQWFVDISHFSCSRRSLGLLCQGQFAESLLFVHRWIHVQPMKPWPHVTDLWHT